MRTEHVQVVAKEMADPGAGGPHPAPLRPRHAVFAVFDEGGVILDEVTVCGRLTSIGWRVVDVYSASSDTSELVPFANCPVADRCAGCQALLLGQQVGQPGIVYVDSAAMHRPLDLLEPPET